MMIDKMIKDFPQHADALGALSAHDRECAVIAILGCGSNDTLIRECAFAAGHKMSLGALKLLIAVSANVSQTTSDLLTIIHTVRIAAGEILDNKAPKAVNCATKSTVLS